MANREHFFSPNRSTIYNTVIMSFIISLRSDFFAVTGVHFGVEPLLSLLWVSIFIVALYDSTNSIRTWFKICLNFWYLICNFASYCTRKYKYNIPLDSSWPPKYTHAFLIRQVSWRSETLSHWVIYSLRQLAERYRQDNTRSTYIIITIKYVPGFLAITPGNRHHLCHQLSSFNLRLHLAHKLIIIHNLWISNHLWSVVFFNHRFAPHRNNFSSYITLHLSKQFHIHFEFLLNHCYHFLYQIFSVTIFLRCDYLSISSLLATRSCEYWLQCIL